MAAPVVACLRSPAISSSGHPISLPLTTNIHSPLLSPTVARSLSFSFTLVASLFSGVFLAFSAHMARKQNKTVPSKPSDIHPGAAAGSNTDPGTRMSTRTSNKDAHPGRFDMAGFNPEEPDRVPTPPSQRREQAALVREEAAAIKANKKAVQAAGVDRAARLENEMQEDDNRADELRRRPPPRPRGRYVPPAAKSATAICMSTRLEVLTLWLIHRLQRRRQRRKLLNRM